MSTAVPAGPWPGPELRLGRLPACHPPKALSQTPLVRPIGLVARPVELRSVAR